MQAMLLQGEVAKLHKATDKHQQSEAPVRGGMTTAAQFLNSLDS